MAIAEQNFLEQPRTKSLSDSDQGKLAFEFIQNTTNRLAVSPDFQRALIANYFNRYEQTWPRHFGMNVVKGPYHYHISSFGGHDRPEKPNNDTGLKISKYDKRIENYNDSFVGRIHASASWTEIDGVKVFSWGGVTYEDQEIKFPGTKDFDLVLAKGSLLIDELVREPRLARILRFLRLRSTYTIQY